MKKKVKKLGGILLVTIVLYLILLVHPSILFANKYEYRNFNIYSDKPITNNIQVVIDDAISRLEYSELYVDNHIFRVYFCNDNWRFKLLARNGNAGGLVNFPISENVFIRESNIETNELIPPDGWMYKPKERPLSYFIAHEAIHSLQRKISPLLQLRTPSYVLEGYADYIAKRPDFQYDVYKKLYLDQDYVMNPENGLYHKYHLYVAHLIDRKGYTFEQLIRNNPDLEETLQQVIKE